MQRAMAKSMSSAWTVPHFGFSDELCVDALMRCRSSLQGAAAARGTRLTYLPLMLKAASLALRDFPGLNARLLEGPEAGGAAGGSSEAVLLRRAEHNIGIAMDTPRGLVVPCVKGVQSLSVLDIAEELARLQELAQKGALGESELSGGSFT